MRCMTYYRKYGEIPTFGFTPDAKFPLVYGEKGKLVLDIESHYDTVIKNMSCGETYNVVPGIAKCLVPYQEGIEDEFKKYLKFHELNGNFKIVDNMVLLNLE
ncbi:MAG: dipeptidase, partial [Faecalibacillus sp.]